MCFLDYQKSGPLLLYFCLFLLQCTCNHVVDGVHLWCVTFTLNTTTSPSSRSLISSTSSPSSWASNACLPTPTITTSPTSSGSLISWSSLLSAWSQILLLWTKLCFKNKSSPKTILPRVASTLARNGASASCHKNHFKN